MSRALLLLLLVSAISLPLAAQPALEIAELEVNYPRIRVYFKAYCNGVVNNQFQSQDFELYENGKLMKSARLHCFDEPTCCVSAVLVMDRSGSMMGDRLENMKIGARSFVNEMSPKGDNCDEAAIVSFSTDVRLDVPMTSSKPQLLAGINSITVQGGTALWDGVASGIYELLRSAKNTCKAVIVLSDGGDNGSKQHTLNSVVAYANANGIRVFTIGLGSGSDRNLPALAQRTNGRHYQSATGSDLAAIYSAIRTGIIGWSFPYCFLEYETGCPDGTERTVELVLKNFCGGTVRQTVRYTAPYLPHLFQKVRLRIGEAEAAANSNVTLPLILETPVNGVFSKSTFSVSFDESVLEFLGVSAAPLMAGKKFSFQRNAGLITIRLEEDVELSNVGGELFLLHFRTKDPEHTVRTPVRLEYWMFDAWCLVPELLHGSVLIRAREVRLSCATSGDVQVRWSEALNGYDPTRFDVTVTLTNSGNREISDVMATLLADANLVKAVQPTEYTQLVSPSTMLPGGTASATWRVEIVSYKDLRSFPLRFRISAGAVMYDECELWVRVDSARGPLLSCSLDMPDVLLWNQIERRFEGNPFPITVTAHNAGNIVARGLHAIMEVDAAALRLLSPKQPDQDMTPRDVAPGADALAQWSVEALAREYSENVPVRVTVVSDNMPTVVCERSLRIEAAVHPLLSCEVALRDSVHWNDRTRSYEPAQFPLAVTVSNAGLAEARNVRVTLLTNTGVIRPINPTDSWQYLTPRNLPAEGSGSALWTVEAVQQLEATTLQIEVLIEADNHAPRRCFATLVIDPARFPALQCALAAPDTVFFREQYYDPEEFDVQLEVRNVGTAATRDVRAQLLQDTRFTITSQAQFTLADDMAAGDVAAAVFRVRMHPRDTDGYDTLWVHVQGEDTDPLWCYHPVWVQRVRMPRFDLQCALESAAPEYDETTQDYSPNPLRFRSTAINIGETWAEDCQVLLEGQTLLTPIEGMLREVGTMQVGDVRQLEWHVRVLPRTVAGWDTLRFQVLGRGGLGRQLVLATCAVPVFVPAARKAGVALHCEAPDSVLYRDKRYDPDPLLFTARIRNTGNSTSKALRAFVELPAGVVPANGESLERLIPALDAGAVEDLSWRLHATSRQENALVDLCVRVLDSDGGMEYCCSEMFIERSSDAGLLPTCSSIDTLYVDTRNGGYLDNPFDIHLQLFNPGTAAAENVTATLLLPGNALVALDSMTWSAGTLAPGATARYSWRVRAYAQEIATDATYSILINADGMPLQECRSSVHLQANPRTALDSYCTVSPTDSVLFDQTTGLFVPQDFFVTMHIINRGVATAHAVRARILTSHSVVLADGEQPIKELPSIDLPAGAEDSVRWRIRPIRSDEDGVRDFHCLATSVNGASVECGTRVFVQGARRVITVSLPEYTVLRYREKQTLPVWISRTVVAQPSEYRLRLHYDTTMLRILAATSTGTLTGMGWAGTSFMEGSKGVVDIASYTTANPLSSEAGVLVNLLVEGALQRIGGAGRFAQSLLRIDTTVSSFDRGAVSYIARDGWIVSTDDCLEPLMAEPGYALRQNRPNPFNPSTVIEYSVPEDSHIRLRVFDTHGREVAVLHEGQVTAGAHSIVFTASNLPSGLYFYRLESGSRVLTRSMLLMR